MVRSLEQRQYVMNIEALCGNVACVRVLLAKEAN